MKPDLSNPDILSCYNSTALNYDLPTKDITLKNDIEVDILDPFSGINGEDLDIIFNDLSKDKTKAINELDFSIEHFDQLERLNTKKEKKFLKKPKNYSLSYKTSTDYFNIYLYWGRATNKISRKSFKTKGKSCIGFIERIYQVY